jgi:DNA transformation protein
MAEDSFKEYVLDQLSGLPEVGARAMFGAKGLYCGDRFFGILDEGRVFFKTDDRSKADYVNRGMGPFTYTSRGRQVTIGFHEAPPEILENAPELVLWARRSIQLATKQKKAAKSKSR